MEKTRTIEIKEYFCDICGAKIDNTTPDRCTICGRIMCNIHREAARIWKKDQWHTGLAGVCSICASVNGDFENEIDSIRKSYKDLEDTAIENVLSEWKLRSLAFSKLKRSDP